MSSFPAVIRDDLPAVVEILGERLGSFAGRRVLVTGATGMLAAYLVDTLAYLNGTGLLAEPCRLVLLGRSLHRFRARFAHLEGRPDVEVRTWDPQRELAADLSADFVVHAAAPASPKDYLADPIGSLDVNTLTLRGLLERARGTASSVLYVSTSEVYGTPDPEAIPTPETYVGRVDPLSRRAYYAEAKRAGETYCRAYFDQHRVPVKIVRPFHVHGPGLRPDDGRVVATLIGMGLRGEPLTLESDGRATRTYGYVSDAAVAMLAILVSRCDGEAFNIGTDTPETSILTLASEIARSFGQVEPVRTLAAPDSPNATGAPQRACPDLGKFKRIFGLSPRIGLAEGLAKTVAWFRSQPEQPA